LLAVSLLALVLLGCAGWARADARATPTSTHAANPGPTAEASETKGASAGGVNSEALYRQAMDAIAQGEPDRAQLFLRQLVQRAPEHAGAWLDIAVLYCGMGQTEQALALFEMIERRFAPPPGILELIALQRAQGCRTATPQMQARLQMGRGQDSNLNQGVADLNFRLGSGVGSLDVRLPADYAPKQDGFSAFSADAARVLGTHNTMGFVGYQARMYDQFSRFNLNTLTLGLEQPVRWQGWRLRGVGAINLTTLGDALYQQQWQLQLAAASPLALPNGLSLDAVGSWNRLIYPTLPDFDSQIWDARLLLGQRLAQAQWQASAGLQADTGTAQRPGNDRSGQLLAISGRFLLAGNSLLEWGWSQQLWQGKTAYSVGLIDRRREQDTQVWRLALVVPTAARQALRLEWRETQNNENISLFAYRAQVLQLSWQWLLGH